MSGLLKSYKELSLASKILIVIYSLIAIKINVIDYSLSPDEIKFLAWAENLPWFQSPSPEYFGQIFWFLLQVIWEITPSFVYPEIAKLIFAVLLFLAFLSTIFFSKNEKAQFYSLALALTSPLFYWNGKMIGPEILSLSLVFFGLAFHSVHKDKLSFFFIGIAVGAKLTVLPVLAYLFLNHLFNNLKFRDFLIYGLLFCLGFIIANPTDNISLILRLADSRGDVSHEILPAFLQMWKLIFTFRPDHKMTWDLILHNSFQDLTFYWFTFALILFVALISNLKLFLSYLVFLIFHFIWIIKGNSGLGFPWYWMSLVPVTLHVFSNLNLNLKIFNHRYFSSINIGIIIIICSFFLSSNAIVFQVHQKQYQKQNIVDFGEDYLCFLDNYKHENLKVMKRIGFAPPSKVQIPIKVQIPMYDYGMEPLWEDWKNRTGEDFYLLISSRFFYGETFAQNILKNTNKLLGRCGDILIFRVYSDF